MGVPSDDMRHLARKRIEDRRGFLPHLLVYLLTNICLVVIWATVANRGFFWPGFVLVFWGIGLVMHGWNAFFSRPITEADVERELRRMQGPGTTRVA